MIGTHERLALSQGWQLLAPHADAIADEFFERLAEVAPDMNEHLRADPPARRRAFVHTAALVFAAGIHPHTDWRRPVAVMEDPLLYVLRIGRHHAFPAKLITAARFALLSTIGRHLGSDYNFAEFAAWSEYLHLLALAFELATKTVSYVRDLNPLPPSAYEPAPLSTPEPDLPFPVVEGTLADFRLSELLRVLATSWQQLVVEIRDVAGAIVGTIGLKTDRVLYAADLEGTGVAAFTRLLARPPGTFFAFRAAAPAFASQPLGLLGDLLAAATPHRQALAAPPPIHAAGARPGLAPVVALASAAAGVGKTALSLNVAFALASQGLAVILVDATAAGDLSAALVRNPRTRPGLHEVLVAASSLDDALIPTALPGLQFLAAGRQPGLRPPEHHDWRHTFAELAARAAIVIVDTPALGSDLAADPISAASHILAILRPGADATRDLGALGSLLWKMQSARPQLLGFCTNMDDPEPAATFATLGLTSDGVSPTPKLTATFPAIAAMSECLRLGVPLRFVDASRPPAAAWLFDAFAAALAEHLDLGPPSAGAPIQLFSA